MVSIIGTNDTLIAESPPEPDSIHANGGGDVAIDGGVVIAVTTEGDGDHAPTPLTL